MRSARSSSSGWRTRPCAPWPSSRSRTPRHVEFDPLTRLTNSDVIHLLAEQLPRWLQPDDFFPVPCCFPTGRSVTCLLTDGTAGDASFGVVPVPPLLDVEDYLDYVSNRVVPDFAVREALERLWSASAFMGSDSKRIPEHHSGA